MKNHQLGFGVLAVLLVFSSLMSTAMMGQNVPANELHDFQAFLNTHQEVRADLSKNPNLIKDPNYLRTHSGLSQFFQTHQRIRAQAWANPTAFVHETVLYGPENQAYMQEGLQHLQQAEAILAKGLGDKGGHRVKAMELIKQAEREIQAGINYANTH